MTPKPPDTAVDAAIDRLDQATKLLPEILKMVDSDVMKANHYLKKSITIAMMAEDKPTATQLARLSLHLENIGKRISRLQTALTAQQPTGEEA